MSKVSLKYGMLVAALVLVACGDEAPNRKEFGAAKFFLEAAPGQTINSVMLQLTCPASAVDVSHTLEVANGEVEAVFGGLSAGDCTVIMKTTVGGSECLGTEGFTVVPGTVSEVLVRMICKGTNTTPDGSVRVTAKVEGKDCSADRIKTIYAIPANILLGESSVIEAELHDAAVVGTPTLSWSVRNDETHTGQANLSDAECKASSDGCRRLTCSGLGSNPGFDTRTSLPSAGLFVTLKYEDDNCFDTEEVWVHCLEGSKCGDGLKEGVEQCDDGNTEGGDGCSATCKVESCGDGILQPGEECDGTDGVEAGQVCTAECKLTEQGECGDGVVNQPSEACDGAAGLLANQQCGADCKILPTCGNDIVEGTEECDNAADATCVECKRTEAPGNNECNTCIAALEDVGPFNTDVCQPNELCAATLSCVLSNASCWTTIVPAACYCGNSQAEIDECENPSFVPTGDCAAELRAGAGAGATNADVLNRYFDFDYPTGHANTIVDAAFLGCKDQCF